ncbi:MAG: histidine kinase [Bacteroidia bacterium]|nr:histidine kinase [Bacteroidia bacterium]
MTESALPAVLSLPRPGTARPAAISRGVSLHLLVWGLLSMPLIFFTVENQGDAWGMLRFWSPWLLSALVFYLNYLWLIDRLLFRDRLPQFLVANLLITAAGLGIIELVYELVPFNTHKHPISSLGKTYFVVRNGIYTALTAGVSVAIRMTDRWYKTESERRSLENERLRSEINHLKHQLHPHFLFNTLNNIYALVEQNPSRAQASIHGLSKLMRYMLYETNSETVPLSGEVMFLQKYIDLMKLRTAANVDVSAAFDVASPQREVAPLLFISLIENAFKHGVSATEPSAIRISLREQAGLLVCVSENTHFPKVAADQSGSGIGLDNLRRRLNLLYPGRHQFTAGLTPEGLYRAELSVQL